MAGPGMETPNELMVVFSNTVTAGFDALSGSVNGVFGLLIALVVALTGIQWALSPNREVLASGFGKVLLIGAFAYPQLPLAQYPEIAPPTISVTAAYPGASSETIAETVASPLEQARMTPSPSRSQVPA